MKFLNSKKAAALIVSIVIIVMVTIYLAGYVIWGIYDQRNLVRRQQTERAIELARSGLNRAAADLYMDEGSWSDGRINNAIVTNSPGDPSCSSCTPAPNAPDRFFILYTQTLYSNPPTNTEVYGSYTVQIDYLQNPKTCSSSCNFYDNRIWIRSTGNVEGVSYALEQVFMK